MGYETALGVVIPTYGRVALVERLLKDLRQLSTDVAIVVVDDSLPEEWLRLMRVCVALDVEYFRVLANVPAKRNIGARWVDREIVLFLDSDVWPCSDLFEAHYGAYADSDVTACLGVVEFEGEGNWLVKASRANGMLAPFDIARQGGRADWGPSANFSVRYSAFKAVGGFYEDFPHAGTGGEDVDLCWRMGGVTCVPGAVVVHSIDTWASWREHIRRSISYGGGSVTLADRHPERACWEFPPLLVCLTVMLLSVVVGKWLLAVLFPLVLAVVIGGDWHAAVGWLIYFPMEWGRVLEVIRQRRPLLLFRTLPTGFARTMYAMAMLWGVPCVL